MMFPAPYDLKKKVSGFTLAELLIALAILGVIATFTIPKVLQAQQSSQKRAEAKETIAAISQAYALYKTKNTVSAATGNYALTPYLNYVSLVSDGSQQIDDHNNATSIPCDSFWLCMKLHNGGILAVPDVIFAGTATTNALNFVFDPDGAYNGGAPGTNNPGKALLIYLYYDGRITTGKNTLNNTSNSTWSNLGPDPGTDPVWWKSEW